MSIFEQVKQLQENIETDLGPVDILINNAGVIWALPLQQGANEGIQKVINVNLLAHFWVSLTLHRRHFGDSVFTLLTVILILSQLNEDLSHIFGWNATASSWTYRCRIIFAGN